VRLPSPRDPVLVFTAQVRFTPALPLYLTRQNALPAKAILSAPGA